MPLYEYHCLECGENFDKIVLFSEIASLPDCPACHSTRTQKNISLFAARTVRGSSSGSSEVSSQASCASSASRFR